MAVPGVGDWQAKILAGIGAPVTPSNLNYLNAWARAEGGGAANNPFNTTQGAAGATPYNSNNGYPVLNYRSPDQGIQATVQTLTNGRYAPIVGALKQGTNAMAAANALAASPWGTGSLVQKILGGGGAISAPSVPTGPQLPGTATPPATPDVPRFSLPPDFSSVNLTASLPLSRPEGGSLLDAVRARSADLTSQLMSIRQQQAQPPPPGVTGPVQDTSTSQQPVGDVKGGDPVPVKYQTSIGPEHDTEGLPGFPAHDYMAPAGSPVVAPVSGKIVRFSGHDPSAGPTEGVHGPFGLSLYLQGDDGKTYYMTHLGSYDVKVGDRVGAGAPLATIGDYAKWGGADHVHMGVSSGTLA